MMPETALALPPERPGYPAPPDLAERRAQMGAAVAGGAFATNRPAQETELGSLRCLHFAPEGEARGYMLQLHGGGFRIGRPEFEAPLSEALATHCAVNIAVPQYRLAPEAPFPAGLNDALAALIALRAEAGAAPLIVSGDSAGAGLAASLGILSAAGKAPRIDGIILLSPWLDLTVTAPSYAANAASDPLFGTESAQIAADLYLQGFEARHPLASPLFADPAGFPPCLVSVGTGEVLVEDSRRFAAKLAASGCDCRLVEIAGMDHVAVVRGADLPGARETFAAMADFIDGILPARA
jgi:acetyl esterase/lipase